MNKVNLLRLPLNVRRNLRRTTIQPNVTIIATRAIVAIIYLDRRNTINIIPAKVRAIPQSIYIINLVTMINVSKSVIIYKAIRRRWKRYLL